MWPSIAKYSHPTIKFLLTHPVWDVTMEGSKAYGRNHKFLLTHPVWDVTIVIIVYNKIKSFLLTHPVWDVTEHSATVTGLKGISTHTSRVGCDWSLLPASLHHCISTHTSRVGCDGYRAEVWSWKYHFYSHIPCGMWRNTATALYGCLCISTHTSRVGCDFNYWTSILTILTFLLTHPVWDVTEIWRKNLYRYR